MTQPQRTSDDINAAINTAARRMTSGEPESDLRARVLARIDVPQRRWGWRLVVAGSAVASIAVVVAVQLVSPKPTPTPEASAKAELVSPKPEAPATVAVAPPIAKANPTAAPIDSSPLLSTPSVHRTATRRVIVAMNVAEQEWRARAVQALEPPDALQVQPLEHPRLTIDPLSITPLSVAPLSVPGMGGARNR